MERTPETIGKESLHKALERLGAQLLQRIGPFYTYENRVTGQPFIVEWDQWDFTYEEALLIVEKHGFDVEQFKEICRQEFGMTVNDG